MMTKMWPMVGTVIACYALCGCVAGTPTLDTGPDAEVSFDGLHKVLGSQADEAWARPDADISLYSKIRLVGVGIQYRPGGETGGRYNPRNVRDHFALTEEQKQRLVELVAEAFVDELSHSEQFELVQESGPDVLLVKGALTDVVSYIPPEPAGRSTIYLSSVGEATLVLEISDSVTETVLARVVDRRAADSDMGGFGELNRVTNAAEVRRLARSWARTLRRRLEELMSR